jgi:hypothetical protein
MKPSGSGVKTTQEIRIQCPEYFRGKKLYRVDTKGDGVLVIGSYAIIHKDTYAITQAPVMTHLLPDDIQEVSIDDTDYIEMIFHKGTTWLKNKTIIQDKLMVIEILTQYLSHGRIPWYVDYEGCAELFYEAKHLGGLDISQRPELIEMLAALTCRDPNDAQRLFREQQLAKGDRKLFTAVPVSNVHFGSFTTESRLIGSYQDAGVSTALVVDSKKMTPTGRLLQNAEI